MFHASRGRLSPVTTIPTKLRGSAMGNGDADEIYQLSFLVTLHLQLLLKMTMVIGLLPMGNGNADWHATCFSWGRCTSSWYYGSWGLASGNGEWRRMRCTCCQGRWSCTMSIYPVMRGKDNGQWSQWREPRYPQRYTVSFEGRSWL